MLHGKKITIIAAMARNRAIGLDGDMPWHLPGELRHFKKTTMGKPGHQSDGHYPGGKTSL
jgi:dihydrofolate reductase